MFLQTQTHTDTKSLQTVSFRHWPFLRTQQKEIEEHEAKSRHKAARCAESQRNCPKMPRPSFYWASGVWNWFLAIGRKPMPANIAMGKESTGACPCKGSRPLVHLRRTCPSAPCHHPTATLPEPIESRLTPQKIWAHLKTCLVAWSKSVQAPKMRPRPPYFKQVSSWKCPPQRAKSKLGAFHQRVSQSYQVADLTSPVS